MRKKDPNIFAFAKQHNVTIPLDAYFMKLLKMNKEATVEYILEKAKAV